MIYQTIQLCPDAPHVTLTTYLFDTKKTKSDALLIIPGGAYSMVCSDREGEDIALAFSVMGVRTFVLNYTVGDGARFPTPLIEASLAMAHIKAHAEEYAIDADRVFVAGFSAGGHLAGSLGTMWHKPEVYEAAGLEYGVNRPAGMLLCYPVLCYFDKTHKGTFYKVFGTKEPTEEQICEWSVERNVDDRTCPAFLMHTANDAVVDVLNNIYMQKALAEAGIFFEAHIWPRGFHGLALATEMTGTPAFPEVAEWPRMAVDWMRRVK